MKTGKAFWIVLLLMVFCGLAGILIGEEFYYRSFYFWLGFCLLSAIWTTCGLSGVQVIRKVRQDRVEVGQYILETIDIENDSRIPKVWIEIIDQSENAQSHISRVVTLIGSHKIRSHASTTIAKKRGIYALGPTLLHASDPFGLFSIEKVYPVQGNLIITPMLIDLEGSSTASGIIPGGKPIRRKSHEMTSFSSSIREYRPGDPFKRIHWPSTARNNELMVKEFDLEPQTEVAIFVNADKGIQWEEDKIDNPNSPPEIPAFQSGKFIAINTLDYMATIACSLGRLFLRNGRMVSLYSNDQPGVDIPPDRSERQEIRILEAMSTFRGVGTENFCGCVTARLESISRGSMIWLISPTGEENLAQLAEDLENRSYHPVLVLLYSATDQKEDQIQQEEMYRKRGIRTCSITMDGNKNHLQSSLSSQLK